MTSTEQCAGHLCELCGAKAEWFVGCRGGCQHYACAPCFATHMWTIHDDTKATRPPVGK